MPLLLLNNLVRILSYPVSILKIMVGPHHACSWWQYIFVTPLAGYSHSDRCCKAYNEHRHRSVDITLILTAAAQIALTSRALRWGLGAYQSAWPASRGRERRRALGRTWDGGDEARESKSGQDVKLGQHE
jgi:hypothetical protein